MFTEKLLQEIRARFHHVDNCPYQGPRVFFENAGGSLTLKSVVEVNTRLSSIPDNQGRDNPASKELVRIIEQARADSKTFLGVDDGLVFVGESGTECIFRTVRAAVLGSPDGGSVLGSTLEHPATVSACKRWAGVANKEYIAVPHDLETATVTAQTYKQYVSPETRVATVIHTSPVSGMSTNVKEIVQAIRSVSPDCIIIVDGIQHAPHGKLDVASYNVDAYCISPYKVFCKHNYGIAWVSPKLSVMPHDHLDGTAADFWELGTRDTSAYATFSEVVKYLAWLGSNFTDSTKVREQILAAGAEIGKQESHLVQIMLDGLDEQKGLRVMPKVNVIGGYDNPCREGLVSLYVDGVSSFDVVAQLNQRGVRTHVRKNDYFSGNILTPMGLETCVRVSMCHYNSPAEVRLFLKVMQEIAA